MIIISQSLYAWFKRILKLYLAFWPTLILGGTRDMYIYSDVCIGIVFEISINY